MLKPNQFLETHLAVKADTLLCSNPLLILNFSLELKALYYFTSLSLSNCCTILFFHQSLIKTCLSRRHSGQQSRWHSNHLCGEVILGRKKKEGGKEKKRKYLISCMTIHFQLLPMMAGSCCTLAFRVMQIEYRAAFHWTNLVVMSWTCLCTPDQSLYVLLKHPKLVLVSPLCCYNSLRLSLNSFSVTLTSHRFEPSHSCLYFSNRLRFGGGTRESH